MALPTHAAVLSAVSTLYSAIQASGGPAIARAEDNLDGMVDLLGWIFGGSGVFSITVPAGISFPTLFNTVMPSAKAIAQFQGAGAALALSVGVSIRVGDIFTVTCTQDTSDSILSTQLGRSPVANDRFVVTSTNPQTVVWLGNGPLDLSAYSYKTLTA